MYFLEHLLLDRRKKKKKSRGIYKSKENSLLTPTLTLRGRSVSVLGALLHDDRTQAQHLEVFISAV